MCLLPVRPCECLGNDIRRNLPRGMRPRPGHPDRRLGDFDLAGDAAREAFARRTGGRGILSNPRAWLMTTARNRGTDRLRVPGGVLGADLGHSEIETICRLRSIRRCPRSPRDPDSGCHTARLRTRGLRYRHRERSSSLQVATCWYLDCMVLLFGAVKQSDSELGALGVLAEVWSANPASGAWLLAC